MWESVNLWEKLWEKCKSSLNLGCKVLKIFYSPHNTGRPFAKTDKSHLISMDERICDILRKPASLTKVIIFVFFAIKRNF